MNDPDGIDKGESGIVRSALSRMPDDLKYILLAILATIISTAIMVALLPDTPHEFW
jgi:hypothetical protein